MTKFSRLTLATLLMGSLALPAFAQDTKSPKDASATATPNTAPASVTTTKAPALKAADAVKTHPLKSGVHKVAATTEVPAVATKAPATSAGTAGTVTGVPSKEVKAKDATTGMGKEAAKDSPVKPQTPTPATKTN